MKKIQFITLTSILLLLLIVIPTGFAANNETVIADGNETMLTGGSEDILSDEYYFDASVDNDDGDGSIYNPYQKLTSERVKSDSINHLDSGVYDFNNGAAFTNVTMIGASPADTIVKNAVIASSDNLVLYNLTFVDSTFIVENEFTAINCIFTNSTSTKYGGVIYPSGDNMVKITLDGCTFSNNDAVCGGAIYIIDGTLNIKNSVFINNTAKLFGGAIAAVRSSLSLENITARNNKAGADGGVVYSLYGNFKMYDSTIVNNQADKGAGVFVDGADYDIIINNRFIDNVPLVRASLYSFYNSNSTITDNEYSSIDDLCETFDLDFIGNGNYTMYNYITDEITDIPSRYDLRDYGYVTSVKDQGGDGNCWAFATMATLESNILKALGENYDLSESNLKNLFGSYSDYGWNYETNVGGIASMGYNYLISWLGPVLEQDDPYVEKSLFSRVFNSIMHVQNVMFIQRSTFTDNDEIKKALMKYGAVYTPVYAQFDKYGKQYYTGDKSANHAIVIVGWDDNMEFSGAPGKGGWIIKNSWGADWRGSGYGYVSYYDKTCVPIGKVDSVFTFILNDTIKYDKNYQYDVQGKSDFFYNKSSSVWYKNKFTATDNEYLTAVSTMFDKKASYTFSVYVNDKLKLTQSGTTNPGYYTFNLNEIIPLSVGDEFVIVFNIKVDKEAGVPISEKVSFNKYYYKQNTSFISYDGVKWADLYDLEWIYSSHSYNSAVACIKAFTTLNPINTTIKLTVENTDNPSIIKALVLNEYGNHVLSGNVTFNIEGQDYAVEIVNGYASLFHVFKNLGSNLIKASFEKTGFVHSTSNVTVDISKGDVVITLDSTVNMMDAQINICLSKPINETVYVNVNQTVHEVKVINGVGKLALTDLYYGEYVVEAYFVSDYYNCVNGTGSFNINYLKTFIEASDLETYHDDGFTYSIRLLDRNNDPISGKTIKFTVGDVTKENTTNDEGIASVNFKLDVGSYTIVISCPQEGKCLKSEVSKSILIKSTIELPSHTTYTYNSKYIVYLFDANGQKLANEKVSLTIGDKNYILKTDSNGKLSFTVNLNPGSYAIGVNNLNTSEVKTQNINVVKRITGNKALTMYYGAGKYYKVKALDDDGKIAKGVKVKFTINGRTYTRTTDSKGYASIKISTYPGKYTITAEYKGFKVSNKITVKSTIISKNINVKKGKTIKFTVKLVNKNGKILKNKKITFKFKGKTYKVKTNKYGKATLKITKKYNKGTYTISSKYGKLTIKNKIRIK